MSKFKNIFARNLLLSGGLVIISACGSENDTIQVDTQPNIISNPQNIINEQIIQNPSTPQSQEGAIFQGAWGIQDIDAFVVEGTRVSFEEGNAFAWELNDHEYGTASFSSDTMTITFNNGLTYLARYRPDTSTISISAEHLHRDFPPLA